MNKITGSFLTLMAFPALDIKVQLTYNISEQSKFQSSTKIKGEVLYIMGFLVYFVKDDEIHVRPSISCQIIILE